MRSLSHEVLVDCDASSHRFREEKVFGETEDFDHISHFASNRLAASPKAARGRALTPKVRQIPDKSNTAGPEDKRAYYPRFTDHLIVVSG